MEILGRLVRLRSYQLSDFEFIRSFRKGDQAWKYLDEPILPRKPDDLIDEDVNHLILKHSDAADLRVPLSLVIADIQTDLLIGEVSRYKSFDDNEVAIGLVIYESAKWRCGIGTEVILLWEKYLQGSLMINRLVIETWTGNRAMMRIAQRCNYRPVKSIPFSASENSSHSSLRYEKNIAN